MPDDSFVLKYFHFLKEFLSVGSPFYIVINSTNLHFDYANENISNKICGTQDCNTDSLQNQVYLWSKQAKKTYIASPAFSWIDDYSDWLSKFDLETFLCRINGPLIQYIDNGIPTS